MSTPRLLSSSSIVGDDVDNNSGENLGDIKDLMINVTSGEIEYAVLSFGGVFGIGDKLFAVPWNALSPHATEHKFILDKSKAQLENAPGFDKNNWPNFADTAFRDSIHGYYG